MTKAAQKTVEDLSKLQQKPIPHAYALVPDPDKPGFYFAVHLENVYAEKVNHLEYSERSSYRTMGTNRILNDLLQRHRKGEGWEK